MVLKNPIKSTGNNILNSEEPLEAFSLKPGPKHKSSSLFNVDLQILVGVMRHEAKLIVIATRKRQNYYLQMTRAVYQNQKRK